MAAYITGSFFLKLSMFLIMILLMVAMGAESSSNGLGLSFDFYDETCPNVENIIRNVVTQKLREAPVTAAGALRIFFHDCFVEVSYIQYRYSMLHTHTHYIYVVAKNIIARTSSSYGVLSIHELGIYRII